MAPATAAAAPGCDSCSQSWHRLRLAALTSNSAATTPNHHLTDPSITLGEATPELPQGDRHATGSATRSLPLGSRDHGPSDSPDSGARLPVGGFNSALNRQFVLQTALQMDQWIGWIVCFG
jgi:hypothetical protein